MHSKLVYHLSINTPEYVDDTILYSWNINRWCLEDNLSLFPFECKMLSSYCHLAKHMHFQWRLMYIYNINFKIKVLTLDFLSNIQYETYSSKLWKWLEKHVVTIQMLSSISHICKWKISLLFTTKYHWVHWWSFCLALS